MVAFALPSRQERTAWDDASVQLRRLPAAHGVFP